MTSGRFSSILLKEIEIDRKTGWSTLFKLSKNKIEYCKVSISHTLNYATAFALYLIQVKIITNEQSKKIDQAVIDNYKISELDLIRKVGKKLGIECINILKNYQNPNILVFSGAGNNGLDSLVVAEMLKRKILKSLFL